MITLVTYKVSRAAKLHNDIFINEFDNISSGVFLKCFSLYPFRGVINNHLDVLISHISCYQFNGPIKSSPHFINGSKKLLI
jgi:hypothetical protein